MNQVAESLRGLTVLIVEDHYVMATELAQTLRDFGACVLGPAGTMEGARALGEKPHDLALLNVDLHGQAAFPLADALIAQGTPVAFVTGYDAGLPCRYRQVPRLGKPVELGPLMATILRLAGRRSPAAA